MLVECVEDSYQLISSRQLMVASGAIVGAAQRFIITQRRKTFLLGTEADALGKDTGKEERVIADVRADHERRAVIGSLEGGQQFKEIIHRRSGARHDGAGLIGTRKFGQHLGHIISDGTVMDLRATQNLPHEDVKIKMSGDSQATTAFQQGVQEGFVIEDEVAGIFVGEEFYKAFRRARFGPEDGEDEDHVFGRELRTTIWLDDFHKCNRTSRSKPAYFN